MSAIRFEQRQVNSRLIFLLFPLEDILLEWFEVNGLLHCYTKALLLKRKLKFRQFHPVEKMLVLNIGCKQKKLLVIGFYNIWWLLKEPLVLSRGVRINTYEKIEGYELST